jgi:hypothetical protein
MPENLTKPTIKPRKDRQKDIRREENAQNRDGLLAAIFLAFFLHLLLFWATPEGFFPEPPEQELVPQVMEVLLEPIPEEPEIEEQYVRAAPDVEEALPDETNNISDRNQQAAQEEETIPGPDNVPYVEGDMEESNRIVQGNPTQQPTPPAPPAASPTTGGSPMVQQEAAPRDRPAEVNPDFLEDKPLDDEGLASIEEPDEALEKPEVPDIPLKEVLVTSPDDGQGQAQMTTPQQSADNQTPMPRPRQRVERDTSYGPVKDNRLGVIQIGRLAFDAEYSEFGEYWTRVSEIIEKRWRNLVYNTKAIPMYSGNRIVVEFAITRDGDVVDVKVSEDSAGKLAETVSVDAIVGEAPFFEWTPEMIVRMGEKARCAIHFFY